MTLLVSAGPYVAVLLAAVLAARAIVVAAGRRFRPWATRLALIGAPLALVFIASLVVQFMPR